MSPQSRRGLDWANFFMSDVQVGFGSFLAFYLADLGWSKQAIGVVLAVGGIAAVVFMIPGGAVADAVRWKRGLAAAGIVSIAIAALVLAVLPSFQSVYMAEMLQGIASGALSPAVAAISLGLAGRHGMSSRIGRNYRYAASGNAITAATMGAFGAYVSVRAIFAVAAALCVPALIALSYIRPQEIDYLRARNATKNDAGFTVKRLADLARNRHLLVLAACIGLFQLANSSLLPLVSETLAHRNNSASSLFMGAMLVVSQVVVALLAPWVGYWSEVWGRKPLLLIGFAIEAVRALLFAFIVNPWFITAIEVLDGVTGAIVIVLTILIVMDLTDRDGPLQLGAGRTRRVQRHGSVGWHRSGQLHCRPLR